MPPTLSKIRFSPSICCVLNQCFPFVEVDTSICWYGRICCCCGGSLMLRYLCLQFHANDISKCDIFPQQQNIFSFLGLFLHLTVFLPESNFLLMIRMYSSSHRIGRLRFLFSLFFTSFLWRYMDDVKSRIIIISIFSLRAFMIRRLSASLRKSKPN